MYILENQIICYFKKELRLFKVLCLLFLPNVPGAMFIQGGTFIPDSRVGGVGVPNMIDIGIFFKFHESQQKQNAVYKLRHLYQMDFFAQEYISSDQKK